MYIAECSAAYAAAFPKSQATKLAAAIGTFFVLMLLGVVVFCLAEGAPFLHGVYYAVVTMTTVGYGTVGYASPLPSPSRARALSLSLSLSLSRAPARPLPRFPWCDLLRAVGAASSAHAAFTPHVPTTV